MEHQCESNVLTADGDDIIQCERPDTHAGQHRNWNKIKPGLPVEWKTGQEVATTSIRVPEVNPEVLVERGAEFVKDLPNASLEVVFNSTDIMVPVAVYEAMVDALERIAKGPDRWGGYGSSPDGNQTPAKIAKAALEAVDV